MNKRSFTPLVKALPATVPFVAPDALERRLGRTLSVRLGANENAFGVSPRASEAMARAASHQHWYADPESFALRARLAALEDVTPEHILVGSGIDDLLGLAVRCFVAPGATAVASHGTYPTFAYHVTGYGGALVTVPYRGDAPDLEALLRAAHAHDARLLYLANPDNPSGAWHPPAAIEQLLAELPQQCVLLLDEAYAEFAPERARHAADDPRLLRVRTFSKLYGMAGARIGYALTTPEVIAGFHKVRLHFGVNGLAQAGALAALDDAAFTASVRSQIIEGREGYAALGASLGLPTLASATNFVLFDLGSAPRARALVSALLERGVFIRMPGLPPLDRCVRITVGTPSERALLAEALQELAHEGALARLGS